MSRDLTPWEVYLIEQHELKNGGISIFDSMRSTIVSYNGKTWPQYSEDEMNVREQFPMLGKLITNTGNYNFLSLHEMISDIEGGVAFLHAKDLELSQFVETGKGDTEGYLIKWFLGELDPVFHYAEYNHRLFGEALVKDAVVRSSKDKFIVVPLTESFTDEVKAIDELSGNNVVSMLDCTDYVWGLIKDQKLIGYCTLGGADVLEDDEVVDYPGYSDASLLLSDVFIIPEYRGQGCATYLVNEVIKKITEQKKELVFLTLLDDNLSHLYEKCGFEVIGRGIMVYDERVKSLDTVLSDAKQVCEGVNKDVGCKEVIGREK